MPDTETRLTRGTAPLVAYILKQRSIAFRIFLLLLIVGGATAVRGLFGLLLPHVGFFSFYYPAVMIVTILAGWKFGLLAIALSMVVSTSLFLAPAPNLTAPTLSIIAFGCAALLQLLLAQWLRTVLKQMERNENRFRQLVAATSAIVWTTDEKGEVEEPQAGWTELTGMTWPSYRGRAWTNIVHAEDRAKVAFDAENINSSGAYHTEVRIKHAQAGWRWFAVRAVPIRDAGGNIREWISTISDVHVRKLAGDRSEMVIGELRHRLKNLFTVIISIAQNSRPRNAPVVNQYISKLNGRLQALSAAADQVMARHGACLDLGEVIRATLAPFTEDRSGRIRIEGPALQFDEQTGGAIALAVYELATNAIKYGALSAPEGRVMLHWRLEPDPRGQRVQIVWRESGGPVCTPPRHFGFGTRVIKFAASHETAGGVTINYLPEGLECRISFIQAQDTEATGAPAPETIGIL